LAENVKRILCTCSENRVRPELSILATGQKDRGSGDENVLNFDKWDKMQLLVKLKKILDMGFRATLNFQKFQVALNPMNRIFLNFTKSCILSFLPKFDNKKKIHCAIFEI